MLYAFAYVEAIVSCQRYREHNCLVGTPALSAQPFIFTLFPQPHAYDVCKQLLSKARQPVAPGKKLKECTPSRTGVVLIRRELVLRPPDKPARLTVTPAPTPPLPYVRYRIAHSKSDELQQ